LSYFICQRRGRAILFAGVQYGIRRLLGKAISDHPPGASERLQGDEVFSPQGILAGAID